MNGIDRRLFLASVAGTLLLGEAQSQETRPRLTPPPQPLALPESWTAAPTIPLWPGEPPGGAGFKTQSLASDWPAVFVRNTASPALHVFRPAQPDGRALLVIPGGAYQFVSVANEGVDLAARMMPLGVTLLVLTYRLPGEGWVPRADVPLQDAQRAMRVIRAQAESLGIDADTLAVVGFSAGGHLAATLATEHSERAYAAVDGADRLSAEPFAVGLVYPVVTMLEQWTHKLSRNLLLGESPTKAEVERRSAELHVGARTPPSFVVHAFDDRAVPVENSLRFVDAMRKTGRPVEAHLLQEGDHAFGVGYPQSPSAQWTDLFDAWWQRLGA